MTNPYQQSQPLLIPPPIIDPSPILAYAATPRAEIPAGMALYTLDPALIAEPRFTHILVRLLLGLGIILLAASIFIYNEHTVPLTFLIANWSVIIAIYLSIRSVRLAQRYNKWYRSYRLLIGPDQLTRTAFGNPDFSITRATLKKIHRSPVHGGLVLYGPKGTKLCLVPRQTFQFEELAATLETWTPITLFRFTFPVLLQAIGIAAIFLFVVLVPVLTIIAQKPEAIAIGCVLWIGIYIVAALRLQFGARVTGRSKWFILYYAIILIIPIGRLYRLFTHT